MEKAAWPVLNVTDRMSIKPQLKGFAVFVLRGIPNSGLFLLQIRGKPLPDCTSDSEDRDQLKLPLIQNEIQLCCSWFCGFPL